MTNKIPFSKLLGKKIDVISTVDHPYTSPPIHLFDAHLQLLKAYGSDVSVMNWDVSLPLEKTYRYDLITDTGLVAKLPFLYHYKPDIPYSSQVFDANPWKILPQYITAARERLVERYHLSNTMGEQIENRSFEILALPQKSHHSTSWKYTRNLLINYYSLFNKIDLSKFIEKQYINYWLSPIMTKWIPWCVLNVDGVLSLNHLFKNNVFLRSPFRIVNQNIIQKLDIQNDSAFIAKKISEGEIIPSFDIFLWSLAVAGIKHYGSDFDFLKKLSSITGIESIAQLQLTKPMEDAKRFLRLFNDYAILFKKDRQSKAVVSDSKYQPSKLTRINSFSSLYVVGGNNTIDYLQKYSRNFNTEKVINLN